MLNRLIIALCIICVIGGTCMAKELESLKEHNEGAREFHDMFNNKSTPCGVACPKCGAELHADYTISLTSNPPQTPIHCIECDYRGSMF